MTTLLLALLALAPQELSDPRIATALQDAKVLVVAFSGPDCPVSRLYKPKLDRLSKEYAPRGVRFLVVSTEDLDWVALLAPSSTTEAFVIDDGKVVRYRGAVDDQYDIGVQRESPTRTWLVDAVEALLAGRPPRITSAPAPGCAVTKPSVPAAGAPTYHRDIAPIFQKRCVACHREGEIGPFPLDDYARAKKSAAQIKRVVKDRTMPPWHADPRHGTWGNDRRLSDADVAAIVAWADGGAPEGDRRDAPPPRAFTPGWQIGTPDAVYAIPKAEKVPAEGTIPYRHQRVRTRLTEDRWVQAIEVRPTAREVVHHVLVFVQYPLARIKEQPPIDGGLFNGYFGIMVPGDSPMVFPEGMAKKIPAGAWLIFQIHYTAVGKEAEDRTEIGLRWAKGTPQSEVVTRGIVNKSLRIPPNAADHKEEASFTFEHDARILSLLPHMHVRGKAFKYVAVHPDGAEEVLLDVPKYDFNWQTCYRFAEPKAVKKGTRIRAFAVFDNSAGNAANPDPSKEVHFGQQTWEEMLIGYMDFVKAD